MNENATRFDPPPDDLAPPQPTSELVEAVARALHDAALGVK